MSGTVGVIASDWGRATLFTTSLTTLKTPPNTALRWALTSDRVLGRNRLVEQSLEDGSEWLLFIDDDQVFPNNMVHRLLSHDKDVVGALYMQRQTPFSPVAFSHKTEDGYAPLFLTEYGPEDLVEVVAIGTGGLLVRSEILRAIDYPWFQYAQASEDIVFCEKVYEAGLGPVYCDLGCRMGHLSPSAVWPSYVDGQWAVGFTIADNFSLYVGIEQPVDDAGSGEPDSVTRSAFEAARDQTTTVYDPNDPRNLPYDHSMVKDVQTP